MGKFKSLLLFCLVVVFASCTNKKATKEVDFSHYSIIIPESWTKVSVKGIDSDVGLILTEKGDSIYSDVGSFSEKFDETNKVYSAEQIKKYKAMGMDTKNLFYSNSPEIDQAQGTFLKEYYYYITIDNLKGKIKVPKIVGNGEVGIYFDSIDNKKNKLSIIGKNLNQKDQQEILKSFSTIKFSNK